MMRVTGPWQTPIQIEEAADRYRRRGYTVAIVTVMSERAGAYTYLDCAPRQA